MEAAADKLGRVLVPPHLRKSAALERDIVFVGVVNKVEIWSQSNYNTELSVDAEELSKLGDGTNVRGVYLLKGARLGDRGGPRHDRLGSLDVSGPSAAAVDDLCLAVLGKRHELGGDLAADLAGVGLDRAVVESAALADAPVCVAHLVVVLLE